MTRCPCRWSVHSCLQRTNYHGRHFNTEYFTIIKHHFSPVSQLLNFFVKSALGRIIWMYIFICLCNQFSVSYNIWSTLVLLYFENRTHLYPVLCTCPPPLSWAKKQCNVIKNCNSPVLWAHSQFWWYLEWGCIAVSHFRHTGNRFPLTWEI